MSETTEFHVLDFDCPSCSSSVERALSNQEGVENVEVQYTTGRVEIDYDIHYSTGLVEIEYDASVTDPTTFEQTIDNLGYTPQPA